MGSLSSSHWELMGDAMVTTDQVRLTPDMQSRQGAVWSRIVSIYTWQSRLRVELLSCYDRSVFQAVLVCEGAWLEACGIIGS